MEIYILSSPKDISPNQLLVRSARLEQSRGWAYKLVMSILHGRIRPDPLTISTKTDEKLTKQMISATVKKFYAHSCRRSRFWKYRQSCLIGFLDAGWRIRVIKARTGETVYAIESN